MASQEVQEMLGVSRTRTYQITNSKTFPDPAAVLAVGRIWRTGDVERWIESHRTDQNPRHYHYPPIPSATLTAANHFTTKEGIRAIEVKDGIASNIDIAM